MKVLCEKCNAQYNIDEGRIGPEGLQIRCPRCLATFIVTAPAAAGGEMFDFDSVNLKAASDGGGASEKPLELDTRVQDFSSSVPSLPSLPHVPASSGFDLASNAFPQSPAPRAGSPSEVPPFPPLEPSALPPMPDPAFASSTAAQAPSENEGQIFDFQRRDIAEPEPSVSREIGSQRYRIRRKSGKVFGPFDGETIKQMLLEHQLIGNEEASNDGTTYKPLGAFAEFAETIRTLMDEPVVSAPPSQSSVYEVTQSLDERVARRPGDGSPPEETRRAGIATPSRFTLLVLGGVILVVVTGLGLGFTRFGFFGSRLLQGGTVSTSSELDRTTSGADTQTTTESTGVKPLLIYASEDTFAGYKKIIAAVELHLESGSLPVENLYLLGLAYTTLLRSYGPHEHYQKRCQKVLEELTKRFPKNAETTTIDAAFLLLTDPVRAHKRLEPLLDATTKDTEALFIAGWATANQKNWRDAAQYFERTLVINPEFVKAYHALGAIYALQGDVENATRYYQKALEKNPQHLSSALELSKIQIASPATEKQGNEYLNNVFGKHFEELAPSERAEAFYLRATIAMDRHENSRALSDLASAIELAPKQVVYAVTLGNFLVKLGEYTQAIATFEKALALDPHNIDAQIGKGRSLWQTGEIQKAIALLQQTSAVAKENPWPLYYLGQISEKLLRPEEAAAFYQKALALKPPFVMSYVALASMALTKGDFKAAQEQLSEASTIDAHAAAVHNGWGELHYLQKKFSQAEQEFLAAQKSDPEFPPAAFNLANTYRELGRYDEAVVTYQTLASLAPKYPNLAREYGYTLFLRKDYPAALKLYSEALRLNPKDDRVLVQTGIASLENGDAPAAIKYFQAAIEINPVNSEALMRLGTLMYRQNELDQAQEFLKRAIDQDKNNPDIHLTMGKTLIAAKQWADALEEFRSALKLKVDHQEAVQEISKLLFEQGRYDEAVTYLNRAIAAQPKQVNAILLLGDAYQNQSLLSQALAAYKKAATLDPKAMGLSLRLARTYDELNQKTAAIKYYLQTVKQEPNNALPHYYLAYIYKGSNKKTLALAEFRRYLEMRPDAPEANEIKDEIAYLQNE